MLSSNKDSNSNNDFHLDSHEVRDGHANYYDNSYSHMNRYLVSDLDIHINFNRHTNLEFNKHTN